jgi:type II secretory pathway pseudopilin PulG
LRRSHPFVSTSYHPFASTRSHALSDSSAIELRRGQSFAGLLLVLLILTLLTAFAAPRVNLSRFRSDAIARQAASVFSAAARAARQRRHDVLVRVDSAGRRLATVDDLNGNGRRDAGERESWTVLDPSSDILDPPVALPGMAGLETRVAGRIDSAQAGQVTFRRGGVPNGEFVLYLTSDAGEPSAWRAVQVVRRTGVVQLWRFDGSHWTRGRA